MIDLLSPPDESELLQEGFSIIVIPPDVFGPELTAFAHSIVRSVYALAPATNPMMRAVYRILATLADVGIRTTAETIVLGLLLASAKIHHIPIRTPPRDLAKEAGVRYSTLLKVRRVALDELGRVSTGS
jgi:hypothetical protein